ncbi:hypothetical protein ACUV84_017930 [Puccinellia chinampoensis]
MLTGCAGLWLCGGKHGGGRSWRCRQARRRWKEEGRCGGSLDAAAGNPVSLGQGWRRGGPRRAASELPARPEENGGASGSSTGGAPGSSMGARGEQHAGGAAGEEHGGRAVGKENGGRTTGEENGGLAAGEVRQSAA